MAEEQTNDNVAHGDITKPSDNVIKDKQSSLNTSSSITAETAPPRTIIKERDPREAVFADKLVASLALIVIIIISVGIIFASIPNDTYTQKVAFGVVLLIATTVLMLWKIPKRQVAFMKHLSDDVRFTLENEARKTLAQILAGSFLLVGIYGTLRTINVSEEGQLVERFNKGVEQLSSDRRHVRIGGIYTLIGISKQSDKYTPAIRDAFFAFIQKNAPYREQNNLQSETNPSSKSNSGLASNVSNTIDGTSEQDAEEYIREIELIMNFLGDPANWNGRLNFIKAYLVGVNFSKCECKSWNFTGAYLDGARFISSNLSSGIFKYASLKHVDFTEANLSYADFDNTDLSSVIFDRANLENAQLMSAQGLTLPQIRKARNYWSAKVPEPLKSQLLAARAIEIEEEKKKQFPPE